MYRLITKVKFSSVAQRLSSNQPSKSCLGNVICVEKLIKKLWEDVGKPIFIGHPGARGPIENLEKHYAENDARDFAFGYYVYCLYAAFINAIA